MTANELMAMERYGNLWVHPAYNGGPLGLITLHCTYTNSTRLCMSNHLYGRNRKEDDDKTFGWLLAYGFQMPRLNLNALRNIAITNYLEIIYPTNVKKPPREDYPESETSYRDRLKRLKPVAHLVIAGLKVNHWPLKIIGHGPEILCGAHPQGASRWACRRPELTRLVREFKLIIERAKAND